MAKPRIGATVTVGLESGIVKNIIVNNGHTVYVVQTDTRQVAVTEAGLNRSEQLVTDRELDKRQAKVDRLSDPRKPSLSKLLLSIKPDSDPIWYDAKCRGDFDPEAWWLDYNIDDNDVPRLARALTMCEACPLKVECLQVGLSDSEINTGIWGGMLPGERIVARYGAPRRSRVQRDKMLTAQRVRKRVESWLHQQMRKEIILWSSR